MNIRRLSHRMRFYISFSGTTKDITVILKLSFADDMETWNKSLKIKQELFVAKMVEILGEPLAKENLFQPK